MVSQVDTEKDVLLLYDSLTPFFPRQEQPAPQNEIEYRSILSTTVAPHDVERYRDWGTFEPAEVSRDRDHTASCRQLATVAALPTVAREHLITLSPEMRADVICGFLGPFCLQDGAHHISQVLLNASRRHALVDEGAHRSAYEDKDLAIAISYKHRDRTKVGGTLMESDAQLLARAVVRMAESANAEKIWVWFDQALALNVPTRDESKWYRYGAIPFLVLPVLRYVNPSVIGQSLRPWLVFEECAAWFGLGMWSLGTGILPHHDTDEYRYQPGTTVKNTICPGLMLRWESALMAVVKYIYHSRDRLLEEYEYAETFKEFVSWTTFIMGAQIIPDSTAMPWYYRIEKSLSHVLPKSREEIVRDSHQWSEEHLQLKEKVLEEASKLFFTDGHDGDTIRPAITGLGSIALLLYDGGAITVEDGQLRSIRAQPESLSMMQKISSVSTDRVTPLVMGTQATRVFFPTSGVLLLLIANIPDILLVMVQELAKIILRSRAEIDLQAFRSGDWACYVSYLAMTERHSSVWFSPIRYMYGKKPKLLQMELFTRGILPCQPDLLLQITVIWERYGSRFEARRICSYALVCSYRETIAHFKGRAISFPKRKLPRSVKGVVYNGDTDVKKAMLGLLEPQKVPKDLSCYSIVAGTKEAEGNVDVRDMDLRETGTEAEYVCAVNGLKCTVTPSNDPRCRWHVSWRDLCLEDVQALPRATIRGRVGATLLRRNGSRMPCPVEPLKGSFPPK